MNRMDRYERLKARLRERSIGTIERYWDKPSRQTRKQVEWGLATLEYLDPKAYSDFVEAVERLHHEQRQN